MPRQVTTHWHMSVAHAEVDALSVNQFSSRPSSAFASFAVALRWLPAASSQKTPPGQLSPGLVSHPETAKSNSSWARVRSTADEVRR